MKVVSSKIEGIKNILLIIFLERQKNSKSFKFDIS